MPLASISTPGVYIQEISRGPRPIVAVGTSTVGFVGAAPKADAFLNEARLITNWSQFVGEFTDEGSASTALSHAVFGFFLNGGSRCYVVNVGSDDAGNPRPITGGGRDRQGLAVLAEVDEVAIVVAAGYTDVASYQALLDHCETLKDRVAILDPPERVDSLTQLTKVGDGTNDGLHPPPSKGGYATFYFPWIQVADPLRPDTRVFVPPSGHLAGVWARTDATRGVHKAPANEPVRGAISVAYRLTDAEQGALNDAGVNCIRYFTREGIVVWGARTLDAAASEWRYLSVRRLFNMIEESIAESTRWVVFEPNDRTLWKSICRDAGAFLTRIWRDGALMGATPEEAFFVQCDEETNPPEVIDAGYVVTVVGIAPVKPAEFIIFQISQSESGVEVQARGGGGA